MSGAITYAVDPARLEAGRWCHKAAKTLGEGDIYASYSADRIGMGKPVCKPFSYHGSLWICISVRFGKNMSCEAYQLVHHKAFAGQPVRYSERVSLGDAARLDDNGFYHGMSVQYDGVSHVLCGPPAIFIEGEPDQLSLF